MTTDELGLLTRIAVALESLAARGLAPSPQVVTAASVPVPSRDTWPTVLPNYGKSKGAPIAGASPTDLEYYANGARRSLADAGKARFHAKEAALLAALTEEMLHPSMLADRGGAAVNAEANGRPSDDDIPF